MITLLEILGCIVLYIFIGNIMLLIFKAVLVIKEDNSSYWAYDEDDVGFIIFWPVMFAAAIAIYLPYLMAKFLTKNISKIFIAVVETIRAVHKVKEEKLNNECT